MLKIEVRYVRVIHLVKQKNNARRNFCEDFRKNSCDVRMPRVFLFRLCLSMAVFFWPIAQSGASYLVERLQKYFCLISPTFFVSAIKLYFNFPFSCCVILNYHSAPLVQSSTNKADLDRVKKSYKFQKFQIDLRKMCLQ